MMRVEPKKLARRLNVGERYGVWEYATSHSLAEIAAPNYFWPVAGKDGLEPLDHIVGYAEHGTDAPVYFELIVTQKLLDQETIVVANLSDCEPVTGGHLHGVRIPTRSTPAPESDAVMIERTRGPGRPRKEAA